MPLHGDFDLTLDIAADTDAVWTAFADLSVRRRWVRLPGRTREEDHTLDLRVGGLERIESSMTIGDHTERVVRSTLFHDVVPGERLVFSYTAVVDDLPRWASLVTVELTATTTGTTLHWNERYVFLRVTGDGTADLSHLRGGARLQLNGLLAVLTPVRY